MSIGEYKLNGKQLIVGPHPNVDNPVIDGTEANDIANAAGAADPFIVYDSGKYYAFVEVFGDVGTYISYYESEDGLHWNYGKRLLGNERDHFSYPLIKNTGSEWYMTPTILYDGVPGHEDFPLYKSKSFPEDWELIADSRITEHAAMDASPFRWGDTWYAIAQDRETDGRYGSCRLYYAEKLTASKWIEHPESPLVSGPNSMVRGYPVEHGDYVDLFIGWEHVRQYRIQSLSPTSVRLSREEILVEATWNGWNAKKMHHIDPRLVSQGHNLIVADGRASDNTYSVGMYTTTQRERPKQGIQKLRSKACQDKIVQQNIAPYVVPILRKVGAEKYTKSIYNWYFENR